MWSWGRGRLPGASGSEISADLEAHGPRRWPSRAKARAARGLVYTAQVERGPVSGDQRGAVGVGVGVPFPGNTWNGGRLRGSGRNGGWFPERAGGTGAGLGGSRRNRAGSGGAGGTVARLRGSGWGSWLRRSATAERRLVLELSAWNRCRFRRCGWNGGGFGVIREERLSAEFAVLGSGVASGGRSVFWCSCCNLAVAGVQAQGRIGAAEGRGVERGRRCKRWMWQQWVIERRGHWLYGRSRRGGRESRVRWWRIPNRSR